MQLQRRPPALTRAEFEAFGRACKQMDALAAMLHASRWNGKGVALVELSQVYEVIAGISNKTEAYILGQPWPRPAGVPQDEPEEGGPGENSSSAPGAAPGSLES